MTANANHVSMYPADFEDRTDERAFREELRRQQLADELAVPLGALTVGALTGGIVGPEYKESVPVQPSVEQKRKIGAATVSTVISIPRSPIMHSLQLEQTSAINEQAFLGHAERKLAA